MAIEDGVKKGSGNSEKGTVTLKRGLAQMLKGGVIMDVVNPDQAVIAEQAGAVAVMALERVPADIRASGGVARMADPGLIQEIMEAVSIPVMAKCRIGHFVEAQILEALGVDYIDESEVLTPADEIHHIYKHDFSVPFVCGCRSLGEALRRIGAARALAGFDICCLGPQYDLPTGISAHTCARFYVEILATLAQHKAERY